MIRGFEQKLMKLSRTADNTFKSSVATHGRPGFSQRDRVKLKIMILSLPEMLRQLALWSRDASVPPSLRHLHLFTLAYLYNPDDFMPEKTLGFWGYLDDAYMVTSAIVRTMEQSAPLGLNPLADNPPLTLRAPEWLELCQRHLPDMTERVDDLLDQSGGLLGKKSNPHHPDQGSVSLRRSA